MTLFRRIALCLAAIAFASGLQAQNSKSPQPVTVSDAKQLVNAIAPGKTIVLKKGDYKLSTAYGVKTKYVSWNDGDDGKELTLTNLQNLTIRGSDGARIVSDSGMSSIIGLFESSNVTFDNVSFVRLVKQGADVGADSLYVESVDNLTLDRCSFSGPTTLAIELWECKDVSIKRTDISGATSGLLSASYTTGLELSGSHVTGCEGYPLLYLEESDQALFKDTIFEGASGGNFIEIYAESGSVESVAFDGCTFKGNQVEYFAGTQITPNTDGCTFSGNSFDENWEVDSVAPASDETYYGSSAAEETGPLQYDHSSGLSFSYPREWDMQEYAAQSRVGVFSPDGKSLVFFLTAYQVPAKVDPAKQSKKVFADAYAALAKLLKSEASVTLTLKADGEPYTDNDLLSADYTGLATKGDGEKAQARARFIVTEGAVEAMVGLAADASSLEADSEIDGIFASVQTTAGGE
jgi:hypothetical protein